MIQPIPKPPKRGPKPKKYIPRAVRKERREQWGWTRLKFMSQTRIADNYWVCDLSNGHGCGKWLIQDQVTVDHIVKKSVAPDRVHDLTNLQVLCAPCHYAKDCGMRVVQYPKQ